MSEEINNEIPKVFFDTETTGRSNKYCGIVEIGLIKRIDNNIVDTLHLYFKYNPEDKWEEEAFKVHGLSQEFLKDKPSFAEEAENIINFISGCDLVAHNATFDVDFLSKELNRAKLGDTYQYINKVYDTLKMSKAARAGKKHSLDMLCQEFNIDRSARSEFHGALIDASLLPPVYDRLNEMSKGRINNFEEDKERSPIERIDLKGFVLPTITVSEEDLAAHNAILQDIEEKEKVIPIERQKPETQVVEEKKEEKKKFSIM